VRAACDALSPAAVGALDVPAELGASRQAVHHRAFVDSAVGVCFFRREDPCRPDDADTSDVSLPSPRAVVGALRSLVLFAGVLIRRW
jgi:hypothetical protein